MGFMGYDAMLGHDDHTGGTAGLRGAGSAADGGRAAVCPEGVAERGRAAAGRERECGPSVVSCLAGPRPAGAEGGRAGRPQAPAGSGRARAGGAGAAPRGPGARVFQPICGRCRGSRRSSTGSPGCSSIPGTSGICSGRSTEMASPWEISERPGLPPARLPGSPTSCSMTCGAQRPATWCAPGSPSASPWR